MLTFIKHVFKNKKKDYLFLFIILSLLASFEFCFLAMYNSLSNFNLDVITLGVLNSLPTLAIFVALLLSVFVLNYFISNKKQEFSILLLSGRKPKDLFFYLFIQFGILLALSFFVGIFGGSAIMSIINYTLSTIQISTLLSYHFLTTLFIYICFLIITIVLILAVSARQFVKLDLNLARYLTHKNAEKKIPYHIAFSAYTKKRKFPIMTILLSIIILYLMGSAISKLMQPNLDLMTLMMSFSWILAGEIIIVNTTIPLLYDILHNSFLIKHPIIMNALSSFNDFSQSMITLINLNAVIVPITLFILFFSQANSLLQIIMIPCFIMMLIMIALCLLLRFNIYQQTRISQIATYHAIGYSSKKMNTISFLKNSLFALFGFVVPLLFLSQLLYKAYIEGYIHQDIFLGLIVFYIGLFVGIFIYIFIKERLNQKEVVQNVKYLNRG